ncbi:hypothetical protein llap_12313 [Limosa lapponica baueri]|uniref:Uncharacterized protein n=1 Tax=Limosa lapponica baueri TaxID=1758121 RepID=A0A2I0TU89_LIMLA|nr:hypothetical protein llap_12313 [Limosa lapponica baueri]
MDQHLAALLVSQAELWFVFPTDPPQGTKIAERQIPPEKVRQDCLCHSSAPKVQTLAMGFDTGADIVPTPFSVPWVTSIKFVDDLKLGNRERSAGQQSEHVSNEPSRQWRLTTSWAALADLSDARRSR